MMATVSHVTAWAGRTKYHADGFLFDWVYSTTWTTQRNTNGCSCAPSVPPLHSGFTVSKFTSILSTFSYKVLLFIVAAGTSKYYLTTCVNKVMHQQILWLVSLGLRPADGRKGAAHEFLKQLRKIKVFWCVAQLSIKTKDFTLLRNSGTKRLTTRRHIAQDSHLQQRCCENLRSHASNLRVVITFFFNCNN